jgi:hypothetical protein
MRLSMRSMLVALTVIGVASLPRVAQAGVTFTFTESGGNVLMQSSGSLNTALLVPGVVSGWGGTGIEDNAAPQSDIMGDTSAGGVDVAFGFNQGTDLSPWIGSMFTTADFNWTPVGTTQFTTYQFPGGFRTPGIGLSSADIVGGIWTPDVSWSSPGTIAGKGMTPGTYTITDAVTSEFITIQIGPGGSVAGPEPGTVALVVLGAVGAVMTRRRK